MTHLDYTYFITGVIKLGGMAPVFDWSEDVTQEPPQGPTPGYYRKPHQLRTDTIGLDGTIYKLVDFFADLTFGWGTRWVILSQDEIIYGKRRPNGEHMPDLRSGLKEKKSIKKAIDTALELGLIEVRQTRWGTAYAIHRRYWGLMDFAPRWEIFGFIYHDPETDPIPDLSPGGLNPPTNDTTLQIDATTGVWNPPDTNTESTNQYYSTHQAIISKQPAESREASLQEAPAKRKDTSQINTSSIDKIGKDTLRAPEVARPHVDVKIEERREDAGDAPPTPSRPAVAPEPTLDAAELARQREEETARAREQAEAVAKQKAIDAEEHRITTRLRGIKGEITALQVALDSPAPGGKDFARQKMAALEQMRDALLAQQQAEPESEERARAKEREFAYNEEYNAIRQKERRPGWLPESEAT